MGLGDEIMALGRAEKAFFDTGKSVAITDAAGVPRNHPAWHGSAAWNPQSTDKLIDCPGHRPYIKRWEGNRIIFNLDYRARAGKVHLSVLEMAAAELPKPYAIVAPFLKENASPNKDWGWQNWAKVIENFPIPVYQLCENADVQPIPGAIRYDTPDFKRALAAINRASIVLCNEGGSHHMAASRGVPAVVVFGAFVPPLVTGYDIHENFGIETPEGYCGRWDPCLHCKNAMAQILPNMVKEKAMNILEARGVL